MSGFWRMYLTPRLHRFFEATWSIIEDISWFSLPLRTAASTKLKDLIDFSLLWSERLLAVTDLVPDRSNVTADVFYQYVDIDGPGLDSTQSEIFWWSLCKIAAPSLVAALWNIVDFEGPFLANASARPLSIIISSFSGHGVQSWIRCR